MPKPSKPPLVRRLTVQATSDGLRVRPAATHQHSRQNPPIQTTPVDGLDIAFPDGGLSRAAPDQRGSGPSTSTATPLAEAEAFGIIGFLSVESRCYLLLITECERVAHIFGGDIYVISGIVIVPLSSAQEAAKGLKQASQRRSASASTQAKSLDGAASSSDDEEEAEGNLSRVPTTTSSTSGILDADGSPSAGRTSSKAANDALQVPDVHDQGDLDDVTTPAHEDGPVLNPTSTQGSVNPSATASAANDGHAPYGRFAERWFSRRGWQVNPRRTPSLGLSSAAQVVSSAASAAASTVIPAAESAHKQAGPTATTSDPSVAISLLPKLLRTTQMLLASKNFYFSYDVDITRRLWAEEGAQSIMSVSHGVNNLYVWNHHLYAPLVQRNFDAYALPIMQGFIGQCELPIQVKAAPQDRDTSSDDVGVNPISSTNSSPHQDTNEQQMANLQLTSRADDADESHGSQKQQEAPPHITEEDSNTITVTLISRRSVKRAGLRYLRRGVDENGNVANFVETEQMYMRNSGANRERERITSFTQIRGSIPLFFSQSPYSLKPAPVLHHSPEINHEALSRHFFLARAAYGPISAISLVDKTGVEQAIGTEYDGQVQRLIEEEGKQGLARSSFDWFDFHHVCRGMHFENVAQLLDEVSSSYQSMGASVVDAGSMASAQNGVFRVNCMDCLDRTNVVQSAIARKALEDQLESQALAIELGSGETARRFNVLWADHGDAISRQYASTAAMKGDYTRTSRRNYRGALTDMGLSLTRYYNGIVNDYFSQAAIDFLLGNVSSRVFEEFETSMMSADPGMSLSKIRQNAIDASAKIVIEHDRESLHGGWAVLTPREHNTLRTLPLEEIVLLVTNLAIYAVHFDWNTEKVQSFERIALENILTVYHGTYITSTLTAAESDATRNVGLVIRHETGRGTLQRVNTRSMSTSASHAPVIALSSEATAATNPEGKPQRTSQIDPRNIRLLAIKALRRESTVVKTEGAPGNDGALNPQTVVQMICDELAQATARNEDLIEAKDIISLAEAKRSTGLLEQWGFSLKKLIWA